MQKVAWKQVNSVLCLLIALVWSSSLATAGWPLDSGPAGGSAVTEAVATPDETDSSDDAESGSSASIDLEDIFAGDQLPSPIHLRAMQEHFKELVSKVRPATVGIQVRQSQGSGVIVSRDGYVLTAAHVIGQPGLDATVILQDGTRLEAKTLGLNHQLDSGMLKITEQGKWPYLDVGESGTLHPGQWVMAIGHPGGFDSERSPPIRVGRVLTSSNRRVVQTDCTLVGGDSGGPLVDMEGHVVGIHSRIGGFLHQNYHVPADTYSINWDDLVSKKVIGRNGRARPQLSIYLGCSFEDGSMKIESLDEDGPCAKAGTQVGDVMMKFDGEDVDSTRNLRRKLVRRDPGDKVTIVVERDDSEIEFQVTLERRGN